MHFEKFCNIECFVCAQQYDNYRSCIILCVIACRYLYVYIFLEYVLNEIYMIMSQSNVPRNITSATCLRRLPYIWRHLRQRNSVNKTEAYHIRQYASRFLTTFWYHIF